MTIIFFLKRKKQKAKVNRQKEIKTKIMQTMIQAEMEESPSTFGKLLVRDLKMLKMFKMLKMLKMLNILNMLKMLIRTRKRVIRPATISTGTRKLA